MSNETKKELTETIVTELNALLNAQTKRSHYDSLIDSGEWSAGFNAEADELEIEQFVAKYPEHRKAIFEYLFDPFDGYDDK